MCDYQLNPLFAKINIFQPKEINARTYMGIGKVEQIRDEVAELGADVVIFDCPLTGSQLRNLGEIVGVKTILLTPIKPEDGISFKIRRKIEKFLFKIYKIKDLEEI